jgi:sialate O-acetylesterase
MPGAQGLRALLALAVLTASQAPAEVKLAPPFTDGMVLQQGMRVPVWGTANPDDHIVVTMCGQRGHATVNASGRWMAHVGPLPVGGPYELTVRGQETVVLKDVLVGEVWVCSGQSNMQMAVVSCNNAEAEMAAADYPQIRLFGVPNVTSATPLTEVKAQWVPCTPETVKWFSGVGYFFGRDLHKALSVPIGLIGTSWGGTAAEAWTSRRKLETDADFQPILERWDKWVANYPVSIETYNTETTPEWEKKVAEAKAAGQPEPAKPYPPAGPADPNRPANLFNAMISPLVPYGIRGAIWYQGESNAGRAYQYRKLLPAMIADWRERWGQGSFAFGIVSLANFLPQSDKPGESSWGELREAQMMTAAQPHNGLAIAIDVGDAADIHPRNKQDVGGRLSLWARAQVYDEDIPYSGPWYQNMKVEGGKIRLSFGHTDGGLVAKDGALKGFAIAGEDRKWVWGDAVIDGDTVVVSSAQVAAPVAVRYAWAENPACNLYNSVGLPAVPFRTDDWPGITADSK